MSTNEKPIGNEPSKPTDVERCQCGYPMPCSKNVPITFCRARIGEMPLVARGCAGNAERGV